MSQPPMGSQISRETAHSMPPAQAIFPLRTISTSIFQSDPKSLGREQDMLVPKQTPGERAVVDYSRYGE